MLGKRETMAKDGRSAMCAPYGLVIGFCVRQQDIVDFEEALWVLLTFILKSEPVPRNCMYYLLPSFTERIGSHEPCYYASIKEVHVRNETKRFQKDALQTSKERSC